MGAKHNVHYLADGNAIMNESQVPEEIKWVDFECPHCGNPVSFPNQWIGKAQECPTCSRVLVVPKPGVKVDAKLPIPLKTSRLLLRQLTPSDSNDLLEIVGDESMARYQDWDPFDEEAVQSWLANDKKKRLFQQGHVFYLAMELLEQPKMIGYVALTYLNLDNTEMSVDILVNKKYQRRGFGIEALRGVMHLLFAGLNVRRLCAWCDCRNTAAVGMLQKVGMRREGQFIKHKFMKGEWVDSFAYALLQDEYGSLVA